MLFEVFETFLDVLFVIDLGVGVVGVVACWVG